MLTPGRLSALPLLALALALAACDSDGVDPVPFDPSTVDYDQVTSTDFGDYVQPLLAARNVFAAAAGTTPGDRADYTWDAIFSGAAGETIVPFDEEGSFLTRFLEDLPADEVIPFPNLRRLEADELRFLKRWIAAGARNDGGDVPYEDAEHVLYAAEQAGDANSVALIDMERGRVIRRVYLDEHDLPSAPYGPHHIVFEPDGSAWYVSQVSGSRVVKLSTSLTLDPGDDAYLLGQSAPFTTPGMMALDANSNRLIVGRSTLAAPGTQNIGVFDRTTMGDPTIVEIPNADIPHGLALTTDGRYALVAPLVGTTVTVVELPSMEVRPLTLTGPARNFIHFAVHAAHAGTLAGQSPDSHASHSAHPPARHLAAATLTSQDTDEVLFFRLEDDGTLTPDGAVAAGDGPFHAHGTADGLTLLVPNRNGNSVSIIEVATRAVREISNPAGGPIAQPHTPAPGILPDVFWVSSSNLRGEWTPTYRFLSGDPGDPDRIPLENAAFGNVAALNSITGALERVIQLRAYPSGLEHRMAGHHAH